MSNNGGRQELQKSLNMKDVLALAFGTMIGWGWIMLAGSWVGNGGTLGAIIAFLLGGVMAIFVGLTYAELTPALPLAGGELVFSYRAMGYNASWFTGWMITLAYLGVAAWEGPALSNALGFLFGNALPDLGVLYELQGSQVTGMFLLIGIVGAIVMTVLNLAGAKSSAIFQTTATVAMAIGGIAFFVSGVATGEVENLKPMFTDGQGLVAVILAVPAMFVGFDVIPQAAEEMNMPLNKIGKVMIIAIVMAATWYIIMILGTAMSTPGDVLSGYVNDPDCVPVANCFAYALGSPVWGKLMICAAMCGILTSWNGFIVGASRVIFSMARAHMLPGIFAKVNKKGVPVAAILLVGIVTILSPLLGKSALVWFVDAAAFGTVVAYFMVSLSFLILRKKEPDLARPFKVNAGIVVGILAVGVALFMATLYLPLYSPAPLLGIEWALVGGWIVLGIILFIANKAGANGKKSKAEIEYQMFGDEYKRF
ncbi:MAG: APC family permease [Clostridiales bacterium]|nr:APC family permease [Clostridiales bacterium]